MEVHKYKLSRLYFKHIHKTELKDRGVTAEELAKALEDNGFIQILHDGTYIELQKHFDPDEKAEYFKTIWSVGTTRRTLGLFVLFVHLHWMGLEAVHGLVKDYWS
jgi:hypothetical protein